MRTPNGRIRCRHRLRPVQRLQHFVAGGLQRVHPEIDGRARGQRRPLRGGTVSENLREGRIKPFRIVAPDVSGRIFRNVARKPLGLGLGERFGREAAPVEEGGDVLGRHAPARDKRTEHERARAVLAHGESGGCALAQGIEHEIADRAPVAGPRKSVREPPILQRFGGGTLPLCDVRENLDGRARPCRWRHQAAENRMTRAMTITHIKASAMAPTRNTGVRWLSRFVVTWIVAWTTRDSTNIHIST